MDENKKDYFFGLRYFSILAICIICFFTVPDGDTLFYKFIGLFGIKPGISVGTSSTLYIYMLLPLVIGIFSIRKILKHWWRYGERFNEYKIYLRFLPLLIITILFLISSNIEAIYYGVISRQDGLSSIVYYNTSNNYAFDYSFENDIRTYSYDMTFQNYSNHPQKFHVKLINDWKFNDDVPAEVFIKNDNGEAKTFTLFSGQRATFQGEFTEIWDTEYSSGSGSYPADNIVLINEVEQHKPKPIKNYPKTD